MHEIFVVKSRRISAKISKIASISWDFMLGVF